MKAEGSVRPGEVVSFEAMAERTMGKLGGGVTGLIYQFYSYASILAYVAASGDVVRLLTQGALSSPQGQVVTVFGIFGLIVLAGSKGIQSINEKLNYVFFLLLATIIGVGMLQVSPAAVVSNTNWGAAPGAAGILLFNVVFHDIIPLICEQLDYNLRKINAALFVGSAVPTGCYVLWLVVSLGGVGSGGDFVDPVKQLMQGSGVAAKVVQLWALLAVVTSFIGCGMAQVRCSPPPSRSPTLTAVQRKW
jgi:tyrosine-specific transport protein